MTSMAPTDRVVERPFLQAETCPTTGRPCVRVPSAWLWEVVEHLSYDRVAVHYRNEGDVFVVCFEHTDAVTTQQILNDWARPVPDPGRNW